MPEAISSTTAMAPLPMQLRFLRILERSIDFYGVREPSRGQPIRHQATTTWKLSGIDLKILRGFSKWKKREVRVCVCVCGGDLNVCVCGI